MIAREPNEKLMLVTKSFPAFPAGGREMLCKLNHDVLCDLYGNKFRVFEISNKPLSGFRKFASAVRGNIDGLDAASLRVLLASIQDERVRKVFIDGSNLGSAVALIKQTLPWVEVVTFFHNVEVRFFWGSVAARRNAWALGVLVANYLAERKAVRLSDKLVCLSERDSRLLKKLYGRGATHISPMALEDKCPPSFLSDSAQPPEKFALFVGGAFYANEAGIRWFVREVAPRSAVPICIVGRGFEALRSELEIPGKVRVIGAVDSLADWYHRAQFVIAPIFDGSGMKTKVAEALMHGKKIVGTPEAFSGYEEIVEQAGWVCRTAEEFVTAINTAQREVSTSFDAGLRDVYSRRYSLVAAQERLGAILMQPK